MRALRDEIGRNVRAGAEAEGRVWAMMWDVSGTPADLIEDAILADWAHLVRRRRTSAHLRFSPLANHRFASSTLLQVNSERILESPLYLRERGRPVVVIWGLGFAERGHDPLAMKRLVCRLRESHEGGLWLMAGTPSESR